MFWTSVSAGHFPKDLVQSESPAIGQGNNEVITYANILGFFLACVYIHANTCMFWWRPEVYFNHSSFFFFKAEFLISLELASSTRLWPDSPTGPPVSASSTQGLQMEAASPSFPWGLWGIELMPLSLCSNRFMDSHLSRPLWLFVCFRSGFFFFGAHQCCHLELSCCTHPVNLHEAASWRNESGHKKGTETICIKFGECLYAWGFFKDGKPDYTSILTAKEQTCHPA